MEILVINGLWQYEKKVFLELNLFSEKKKKKSKKESKWLY